MGDEARGDIDPTTGSNAGWPRRLMERVSSEFLRLLTMAGTEALADCHAHDHEEDDGGRGEARPPWQVRFLAPRQPLLNPTAPHKHVLR